MDGLLTRGVTTIVPSKNELEKALKSGKKLNIYFGIDPTATKIHLGHAFPLRKLQKLTDDGHNITFLIGDFTALIGDTSDKDTERPSLTPEEIKENFETYKNQASKILDFSKIQVKFNSEWLSKLSFEDIVKLTQNFSANDLISRELIKKRLESGKRVGLHEFLYPVMQGYDSYHLDTDVQIGGADQVFNMQAGRTLQKALRNKESFVLCTDYLLGTDGRKMSKSWGNAIWLTDEPFEMFRKVMSINDDLIKQYYLLGTNISEDQFPSDIEISDDPMLVKKKLAHEIVKELHSEKAADEALSKFEKVVQNKELPDDIGELNVTEDTVIDEEFLINNSFAESKSEAKRLFNQNAVSLDSQKVKSGEGFAGNSGEELVLKVGKRMVKLKVQ
ncbi:tyrosine--tRNA ligase [Candidatus Dojkabacteria bacterium]|uniref:Tyrosine--tRNA ligase n=1 Tax=Candidatus Dojkabacteria bacterium TaxID=2099670 RepID=A0A5C7J4S4_9BACT|nr:MAG: tyrosine--tRNA ligase [Candidatus Dojkabacteria bacterium]